MPEDFYTPYIEPDPDPGYDTYSDLYPEDHALSFEKLKNDKANKTDWDHWLRLVPGWTPDEAASNMMEIDPRKMRPVLIKAAAYIKTGAAAQFAGYKNFFLRAIDIGSLHPVFTPFEAAACAIEHDLAIPLPLETFLSESQERLETLEFLQQEVATLKAEIEKLQGSAQAQATKESRKKNNNRSKILIAMAICKYAYDPRADWSTVTAAVQSDCDRLGFGLKGDAIRSHLSESAGDCDLDPGLLDKILKKRKPEL
jgi:hypothetical protein